MGKQNEEIRKFTDPRLILEISFRDYQVIEKKLPGAEFTKRGWEQELKKLRIDFREKDK